MSRKMSRLFKIIIPSGELLWSDGSFPHRPAGGHLTPFFPLLISPQRGCPFSFQSHPDLKCYCSRAKQQRPQDTFFGLRCGVWPAPQPTLMCQVRVISQSPVNPPFPLTNVIVSNGDFLFFFGCNMRRHLIPDAPHAVIVLAHRLSPGLCMDLLHSGPTMWGRVLLFSFLIKHTSEPIVMIFGCNSIWWVSDTPLKSPFIFRCCGFFLVPSGRWLWLRWVISRASSSG